MKNYENIFKILNEEIVLALGCTEPISVALASAFAKDALGENPDQINLYLSGNVIKNAMGVGIPGTDMIGPAIASALGAIAGDSAGELEVLRNVKDADIVEAKKFVKANKVYIEEKQETEDLQIKDKLYIEVVCKKGNKFGKAIIQGTHTNIIFVENNEKVIFDRETYNGIILKENKHKDFKLSVDDVFDFANNVDFESIKYIIDAANTNMKLANEGLKGYGIEVGKMIEESISDGLLNDSPVNRAMMYVASAVDARMSGSSLPAVTNSGSGNQGITIMLPILVFAEHLKVDDEKKARALIFGNLMSIHIKTYLGRLSALCGVIIAATASSAAITYLSGGTLDQIKSTIKNMAGNVSGMFCDGAKPGCALKASTATNAAMQSSILALNNRVISDTDGIINKDIEKTIENLAKLGSEGMHETDKMILNIMTCK